MGSKKPSARRHETAAFKAELHNMDDAFARAAARSAADAEHREQALRDKACESKSRYASRAEAKAAIDACQRHGAPALYVYRCPYCNGWHLTHKRPR